MINRYKGRFIFNICLVFAVALPGVVIGLSQNGFDYEESPIKYSASKPNDPISKLQADIDAGRIKLSWDDRTGYLVSVLKNLGISGSSQILVFSKTSFQRELISPEHPRALYFNDHTYIGFVQGAPVLEVATTDPQLGAVFYVLDQDKSRQPKFFRQTHECLQCHDSNMAGGVPGHIMRSVYTRKDGQPELREGSFVTNDQSPFKERWGGWYVSGTHGSMRHLGNVMIGSTQPADTLDLDKGANLKSLHSLVDTNPYINSHSDIVALMVSEHQIRLMNLLTRANYQARMALDYEKRLKKELGYREEGRLESVKSRINSSAEALVAGLLMCKEEKLTDTVKGNSGFAETFQTKGPFDGKGRSLRELDLNRRLFKYSCSYMIYSETFDQLPDEIKHVVYDRLLSILRKNEESEQYSHLSKSDRTSILEILLATKPSFAKYAYEHN